MRPEAGMTRISCTYCSANLIIPDHLQTKAMPKLERSPSKAVAVTNTENEAAQFLRKAQPAAIGAWNLYALWTWARWILPTCLIVLLISIGVCVILGAAPIILNLF